MGQNVKKEGNWQWHKGKSRVKNKYWRFGRIDVYTVRARSSYGRIFASSASWIQRRTRPAAETLPPWKPYYFRFSSSMMVDIWAHGELEGF